MAQVIYTQTTDEIITDHIEKIGGLERLNSVHSIRVTGVVKADTMKIPLVLEIKGDDKIRMTLRISGKDIIQVYDGKEGWYLNPYDNVKIPQPLDKDDIDDLKESIDWKGKLIGYKSKGFRSELIKSNADCCYNIQLIDINDFKYEYYIDKSTNLLYKTLITNEGITEETIYSDFRKIDGILFAFRLEKKVTGKDIKEVSINLIEKVELNILLDDSIFMIN